MFNGKLKTVSLFSGIGAFEKALKNINIPFELLAFSEIDKWAITSYCAIHGVNEKKNMGDITKIHPGNVPDSDLITHGSPCFRRGTLITTSKGYKLIEDIKVGDLVLTHRGRHRKVLSTMITKTKEIYDLKIQGSASTFVTEEHPYYAKSMTSENGETFSKPMWKKVSELTNMDYIGLYFDNTTPQDIVWRPFENKTLLNTNESVYNFEVDEDNSYVANNCIVHNCQDFSIAGKGMGGNLIDKTRSSLMWHTVNIVEHKRPKYVMWENVKGVLNKNHVHNFESYLDEMMRIGYNNYYEVLNAKDYGIPQNRERIFVVSIRRDVDRNKFVFPDPFDNGLRLKHMLEDNVDSRYYISHDKCNSLLKELKRQDEYTSNILQNKKIRACLTPDRENKRQQGRRFKEVNEPMFTITAQDRHGIMIEKEKSPSELLFIGGIGDKDWASDGKKLSRNYPQGNRVYDSRGIACSQTSQGGGIGSFTGLYLEGSNNCKHILDIPKEIINDNERQRRVYSSSGISPSILARSDSAKILQVGMIDIRGSEQVRRVYDSEGIAPTLDTMQGGHRQPKVMSSIINYAKLYYKEKSPNVTVHNSIKPSVAKNFEREKEDILSSDKDIYQCECTSGWQDNKVGLQVSPTLRAGNSHTSALDNQYRIRKLTPLECWRLMGFTDLDYFTAKNALEAKYYNGKDRSNSQMYKQAGNSIVVNVLEGIFANLFLTILHPPNVM